MYECVGCGCVCVCVCVLCCWLYRARVGGLVGECVCAIATKVMSARPKSKQLGFDVCLQFVENEVVASVTVCL